jgi:hypothetical protein
LFWIVRFSIRNSHWLFEIRHDASHASRCINYILRLLGFKKTPHRRAVHQVQFLTGPSEDALKSLSLEASHHSAANHPAVSGHKIFDALFMRAV